MGSRIPNLYGPAIFAAWPAQRTFVSTVPILGEPSFLFQCNPSTPQELITLSISMRTVAVPTPLPYYLETFLFHPSSSVP